MTAAAPGGIPQHNFHVFAVYPWLGLLRAGMDGPPLTVLDRCRIRWGCIQAITGDRVTVRSRPLCFDGSHLILGAEQTESARRSVDGMAVGAEPRPGDVVSLHWDWVCDRLSPAALRWLQYCTPTQPRHRQRASPGRAPQQSAMCNQRSATFPVGPT